MRAAKIMDLKCSGVDIPRSNDGPFVTEVNSSPRLEGIKRATGKNIAGMIVKFIAKNARHGRNRMRGKG